MDRRNFIVSSATLAGMLATSHAVAAGKSKKKDAAAGAPGKLGKERQAIVATAHECLRTGEACLAMCNDMIGKGMKSMVECQTAVVNMLAVTEAMAKLATHGTMPIQRLKAMAQLCADTCRDCERACKSHSSNHAECKACMEDCVACAKACDAFVKA